MQTTQSLQSPWQLTMQESAVNSLWKASEKSLETIKSKIQRLHDLPKEERETPGNQALLSELRDKCVEAGRSRYEICIETRGLGAKKENSLLIAKNHLQEQTVKFPWNGNITWNSQTHVDNKPEMVARLRAAGLPLAESQYSAEEDESDSSKITALISMGGSFPNREVSALIATPSGLVYRFEPKQIEPQWWSFAARYHYVVTGNLADRHCLAELAGIDIAEIKGKTIIRKKSQELSGLSLDELINLACPPTQKSIFTE